MVVDGGALNLLSRSGEWWRDAQRECVLTPHPGEFARLMGAPAGESDGERMTSAIAAAQRFGQVVVLKGARTVVAAPDGRSAVAPFANAALATAGSGDVLAGTIGSLLAQGVAAFDAACLGVYLHGRAGERLRQRLGDAGLLASDLPYEIALARHELVAGRG
jgi:NAD(P)H-hydrate epimerase